MKPEYVLTIFPIKNLIKSIYPILSILSPNKLLLSTMLLTTSKKPPIERPSALYLPIITSPLVNIAPNQSKRRYDLLRGFCRGPSRLPTRGYELQRRSSRPQSRGYELNHLGLPLRHVERHVEISHTFSYRPFSVPGGMCWRVENWWYKPSRPSAWHTNVGTWERELVLHHHPSASSTCCWPSSKS